MAYDTGKRDAVANAVLDKIAELAPEVSGAASARMVLDMAEAFAWVVSPPQSHGGGRSGEAT